MDSGHQWHFTNFKFTGLVVFEKENFEVFFFWRDGHLGHETKLSQRNICPLNQRMLQMQLRFDLKQNIPENNSHLHEYNPGTRANSLLWSKCLYNHNHAVILIICCMFSHSMALEQFSHLNAWETIFVLVVM